MTDNIPSQPEPEAAHAPGAPPHPHAPGAQPYLHAPGAQPHPHGHPQTHAPAPAPASPTAPAGFVYPAGPANPAGPGGPGGPGGFTYPAGPAYPADPTGPAGPGGPGGPGGPDILSPFRGLPFGSSYRTPRNRWWRGVLSIAVVIAAVLLFSLVLSVIAVALDIALGLQDPAALVEGQISMTPTMLAATNLSLVLAGALSLIAHRFINGVRVGYFHSVAPGLRWGWMWLSFALVAPVYLLFAASSFLDPAFQTLTFSGATLAFLFVIILTTPLQAAAEEYMFRGVIQRSVGSWFRSPRWSFLVGTAVSAVLFSAAHFAADVWLIVYYLLFGVLLSILTQRTGGLEAAIAIHTANNLFLLLVSAFTGQMDAGFDRSAGVGGPVMLVPVVILAVVLLVLSWVAKRRKLATTTGAGSQETVAEAAVPPAAGAPAGPAAFAEAASPSPPEVADRFAPPAAAPAAHEAAVPPAHDPAAPPAPAPADPRTDTGQQAGE